MSIILAPDKFKGSLSSFEVCQGMLDGLQPLPLGLNVLIYPMADGGDGFALVMQHYLHTTTITSTAHDPLMKPIEALYQWQPTTRTAIIETATASGLVLLNKNERNPLYTSTYGTGQLIKDAADRGAGEIILGLGGSATNDGGMGILAALGFKFLDQHNQSVFIQGRSLGLIKKIIVPSTLPRLRFRLACDVDNTLYGPEGAAYIYAPQKGADEEAVQILDAGLRNFAEVLERQFGKEVASIPGSGAAGGIAAGLIPFFDVKMERGIDLVIAASGIGEAIRTADLVITGEGSLDRQSASGKVVGAIAALARTHQVRCIAVCGSLTLNTQELSEMGIAEAHAISGGSVSIAEATGNARNLVAQKVKQIADRLLTRPK